MEDGGNGGLETRYGCRFGGGDGSEDAVVPEEGSCGVVGFYEGGFVFVGEFWESVEIDL